MKNFADFMMSPMSSEALKPENFFEKAPEMEWKF
jgi:hypothetical protein